MQHVANQALQSSAPDLILHRTGLLDLACPATPETAIHALMVSASHGFRLWEPTITRETAMAIANDPQLCNKFLAALSRQPAPVHAARVLDNLLSLLDRAAIDQIFAQDGLRRRSHPAITCYYHASFASPAGIGITSVLEVYVKHGLPVDSVVAKNIGDLERATSVGHRSFLTLIIPQLKEIPEEVLRAALCKSMYPMQSISVLLDDCNVPIDKLMGSRLFSSAKPEARNYLRARLVRMRPIPEAYDPDADSAA